MDGQTGRTDGRTDKKLWLGGEDPPNFGWGGFAPPDPPARLGAAAPRPPLKKKLARKKRRAKNGAQKMARKNWRAKNGAQKMARKKWRLHY